MAFHAVTASRIIHLPISLFTRRLLHSPGDNKARIGHCDVCVLTIMYDTSYANTLHKLSLGTSLPLTVSAKEILLRYYYVQQFVPKS